VAFRDLRHGVIGGGDLDPTAPPFDNFARTSDGGKTWAVTASAPVGTIFGLGWAQGREDEGDGTPAVVVTGPGGSAWSADAGDSWTAFDGITGCWATAFADERNGWLVGTGGQIHKVTFPEQ
jgi:hypothetical protein